MFYDGREVESDDENEMEKEDILGEGECLNEQLMVRFFFENNFFFRNIVYCIGN